MSITSSVIIGCVGFLGGISPIIFNKIKTYRAKNHTDTDDIVTLFKHESDVLKIIRDALINGSSVSIETYMRPQEETFSHMLMVDGKKTLEILGNTGGIADALGSLRVLVSRMSGGGDGELIETINMNLAGGDSIHSIPAKVEVSIPKRSDYLSSHIVSFRCV